ncbi:MAG: hypothetical protein R3C19_11420 [Planctomycetaceae bacterium]
MFDVLSGHDLPLPVASHASLVAWQDPSAGLVLLDLNSNQKVVTLPVTDNVEALDFSRDGRYLAVGSVESVIYDLSANAQNVVLDGIGRPANCLAFPPDSSGVAAGMQGRTIHLSKLARDGNSQNAVHSRVLHCHAGIVRAVLYSADGETLFSAASDRTIRVWDVATGQQRAVLKGHTNNVDSLALSPDGRTLASAGSDNTVRIWRTASERDVRDFP